MSEQISSAWVEGAKRECAICGIKITNLAKQVGEVRTVYPSRRREIVCSRCVEGRVAALVKRTRSDLGLSPQ
jgi:hypothetical protein